MAKQRKPVSKPLWHEKLGELSFQGRVLRRFRRPAPSQERLLAAFQARHWRTTIPNPFLLEDGRPAAELLKHTLKNANQKLPVIHFSLQDKGKSVSWHFR